MHTYHAFLPRNTPASWVTSARAMRVERRGFHWGGLFFGPLWLLLKGGWLVALLWLGLYFAFMAAMDALDAPGGASFLAGLVVFLWTGFAGSDWLRWQQERLSSHDLGFYVGEKLEAKNYFFRKLRTTLQEAEISPPLAETSPVDTPPEAAEARENEPPPRNY